MWVRELDESSGVFVNWVEDQTHERAAERWEEHYDEDGSLYYYEQTTGVTSWDLPLLGEQPDDYQADYGYAAWDGAQAGTDGENEYGAAYSYSQPLDPQNFDASYDNNDEWNDPQAERLEETYNYPESGQVYQTFPDAATGEGTSNPYDQSENVPQYGADQEANYYSSNELYGDANQGAQYYPEANTYATQQDGYFEGETSGGNSFQPGADAEGYEGQYWDDQTQQYYSSAPAEGQGWYARVDEASGYTYYIHESSGQSEWQLPEGGYIIDETNVNYNTEHAEATDAMQEADPFDYTEWAESEQQGDSLILSKANDVNSHANDSSNMTEDLTQEGEKSYSESTSGEKTAQEQQQPQSQHQDQHSELGLPEESSTLVQISKEEFADGSHVARQPSEFNLENIMLKYETNDELLRDDKSIVEQELSPTPEKKEPLQALALSENQEQAEEEKKEPLQALALSENQEQAQEEKKEPLQAQALSENQEQAQEEKKVEGEVESSSSTQSSEKLVRDEREDSMAQVRSEGAEDSNLTSNIDGLVAETAESAEIKSVQAIPFKGTQDLDETAQATELSKGTDIDTFKTMTPSESTDGAMLSTKTEVTRDQVTEPQLEGIQPKESVKAATEDHKSISDSQQTPPSQLQKPLDEAETSSERSASSGKGLQEALNEAETSSEHSTSSGKPKFKPRGVLRPICETEQVWRRSPSFMKGLDEPMVQPSPSRRRLSIRKSSTASANSYDKLFGPEDDQEEDIEAPRKPEEDERVKEVDTLNEKHPKKQRLARKNDSIASKLLISQDAQRKRSFAVKVGTTKRASMQERVACIELELMRVFKGLACMAGRDTAGSLKKEDLMRLLAQRPEARALLSDKVSGLGHLFKPANFSFEFRSADKDGDGALSSHEFVKFCMARRVRQRQPLRPYKERISNAKRKDFETLFITVKIPPELKGKINKKLGMVPYSHKSRRKAWEHHFQKRRLAWEDKCRQFKSTSVTRFESERARVEQYEKETTLADEEEVRSRTSFRRTLTKELYSKWRASCAPVLERLRKVVTVDANQEENQVEKKTLKERPLSIRRIPSLRAISNFSFRDKRRGSATSNDNDNDEEEKIIVPPIDPDALAKDANLLQSYVDALGPAECKEFEEWKKGEIEKLEATIQAQLQARITQYLKRKKRLAKIEADKRASFEAKTLDMQNANAIESELWTKETIEMENLERGLRRLEDRAYLRIVGQRKHYLSTIGLCLDRAIVRRMVWESTLKREGQLRRALHLVRDTKTKTRLVLVTLPLSRGTSKVRDSQYLAAVMANLRTFQLASIPRLLSRAERQDDRMPTFSKYILGITDFFSHRIRSWNQVFAFTEYCSGGSLRDALVKLYGDPNQVVHTPEHLMLKWTEQLAKAIRALHGRGVAHRGIDPHCIFFNGKGDIKLGLPKDIRAMTGEDCQGLSANPALLTAYSAPELASSESLKSYPPKAADIYSLGAVIYHVAAGSCLPHTFSLSALVAAPKVRMFRRWFRDFLRMTLQQDPFERGTITEVVDFFSDNVDEELMGFTSRTQVAAMIATNRRNALAKALGRQQQATA